MTPCNLSNLFDEGFAMNSNRVAVKYDGRPSSTTVLELTYAQVNENADVIARHLRGKSVHHQIVCCSSEPHVNIPSVMLGVMRVPAAFFFVDLSSFSSQQYRALTDLHIRYVLADGPLDRFVDAASTVSTIRGLHGLSEGLRLHELLETKPCSRYKHLDGWDVAYAVTTSGSTGTPKFVKVPHRCIVPNVVHFRNVFSVSPEDTVFVASPLTFDPSVVDIFLALSSGASIVLVCESVKRSPRILASILTDKNRISIVQATPSLMRRFGVDLLRNVVLGPTSPLRVLSLGGEPCPSVTTLSRWTEQGRRGSNGNLCVEIYNVYGITEVSSWASLHRINLNAMKEFAVPLGEAIPGTEMIVLDKNGDRVHSGEGQLFLGGSERICFVDSEDLDVVSKGPLLRPTGDCVSIDGKGQIFHLDRMDDFIKRNGKLVSLKQLEKVSSSFPNVCDSRTVWDRPRERLILAVACDNYAEIVSRRTEEVVVQKLKHHMTSLSADLPDCIVLLDSLPVTAHDKFDKRKVVSLAETRFLTRQIIRGRDDDVCRQLRGIWNSARNVGMCDNVNDVDNFLFCGGDSVGAIAFCEEVRCRLQLNCPQLLDKVLHETFAQICQYLLDQMIEDGACQGQHASSLIKRDSVCCDRLKFESTTSGETNNDLVAMNSISRGSSHLRCVNDRAGGPKDRRPCEITFSISWRYNTGKCVDASPLLVLDDLQRWTVFIGSHSRAFVAVDLEGGQEKWRILVGDRIESSACASPCSKYVIVGSYDHYLYCLTTESGELRWRFETGGAVKSSPVVHPRTGRVFFGSHDCSVYALEIKTGLLCWSCKPGKGSIFSSPCLILEPFHHLYVGSLDGIVCALCPNTGQKLWSYDCGQPLFSSPAVTSVGVCVGCVDSTLYCFSHIGTKLWQFVCEAPLFSSPCFHRDDDSDVVFVGSHDRRVYCFWAVDGRLRWTSSRLESEIYSTPFAHGCSIYVCTTRGNLHALNARDGASLGQFSLPGDVFSSPVVVRDSLLVGCRDDHLYCLNIDFLVND